MSQPVIQVRNLGKLYRIHSAERKPYSTFREDMVNGIKRFVRGDFGQFQSEDFWALKDVSFDVHQGEVVGIIGRNGAGKSTLLKILSRIVQPTTGEAIIRGRVGSLLEVGTGFHPELTGRENIFMNGAVLGMKRAEIKKQFDAIAAFAEVDKFLDTPVKFYSSGMYVRLAFAVAAHLEPEILIVDEVLAVGDAAFQKKCLGKMGEVSEKDGRTVLFVSHNMVAVKSLCEKSILLSNGCVLDKGNTYEITDLYLNQLIGERVTKLEFKENKNLSIQFLSVDLINKIDRNNQEIIIIEFQYLVRQETDNVLLCVEVQNSSGEVIFYFNDNTIEDKKKRQIGVHNVSLTIPKHLLTAGDYFVAFGFWEPGHAPIHFPDQRLFFHKDEPSHSLSKHGIRWPGFLYLPNSWNHKGITT